MQRTAGVPFSRAWFLWKAPASASHAEASALRALFPSRVRLPHRSGTWAPWTSWEATSESVSHRFHAWSPRCISFLRTSILALSSPRGPSHRPPGCGRTVFSSTGFRIRAAQGQAANHRFARWAERAAASVFFTLFPADCRICGSPL